MEHKLTIRDIAKRAKVGTTTVSRVLNNHPYVSEEKRHRVLTAIKELDYHPNSSARHLRGSRSGLIGFLTDDVATTPYAVEIIKGAQEVAWEHNMILLVADSGQKRESAEAAAQVFLERQVEGIVYAAMYHRAVELPKELKNIPTVLANCFLEDRSLPSAVPDEQAGGFTATNSLIENGHRRIGFINLGETEENVPPPLPAITGRLAGYKEALAGHGIPFEEELLIHTNQTPHENYQCAQELMSLPDPPTAIFCGNDLVAMACYNVLSRLGLRIPQDVAIVGFDNYVDVAGSLLPPLTTMQLPHYEMGKWAVEYLVSGEIGTPIQHRIDCPLILRESI